MVTKSVVVVLSIGDDVGNGQHVVASSSGSVDGAILVSGCVIKRRWLMKE